MASQPELVPAVDDGLGLRHDGERRSGRDRRHGRRSVSDRRVRQRRLARARSLLFTALALALPVPLRSAAHKPWVIASITRLEVVPIASIEAVPIVAVDYEGLIREAATQYDLDARLIRSVIQVESAFDSSAVSPVGALGLMQLMPALAAELGVQRPFDPRENIMAGARYLRQLLDLHRGNVRLALASYNAGPGTVARYGRIPPYPETREYVQSVTKLMAKDRTRG